MIAIVIELPGSRLRTRNARLNTCFGKGVFLDTVTSSRRKDCHQWSTGSYDHCSRNSMIGKDMLAETLNYVSDLPLSQDDIRRNTSCDNGVAQHALG
jgi:hypothetical protein